MSCLEGDWEIDVVDVDEIFLVGIIVESLVWSVGLGEEDRDFVSIIKNFCDC